MYFGYDNLDYRFWMGIGVTAYGFTYFLLHDVFIHRRGKFLDKIDNSYFQAMRKAHKVHHKKARILIMVVDSILRNYLNYTELTTLIYIINNLLFV